MNEIIEKLHPEDSKHFLSTLKKVLEDIKQIQLREPPSNEFTDGLVALVKFYLKCPNKFHAKRVVASFFQKLDYHSQDVIQKQLCSDLLGFLSADLAKTENVCDIRQTVDNINFFLENFKIGERCLAMISKESLHFLIDAEEYFLSHIDKDVPPVYLNELMHHCHVTMQTFNRVLQKLVLEKPEVIKEFVGNSDLMARLMDTDIMMFQNESLLMDCRCCSAINVFLLIQIAVPFIEYIDLIPHLLFPNAPGIDKSEQEMTISWLSERKHSFYLIGQTPLSYLAVTYGYIAMKTPQEIMKEGDHGKFFYTDVLLPNLLKHGEICEDTVSKGLYSRTINLWTTKLVSSVSNCLIINMANRLLGDSPAPQSLLQYVWLHWEDQIDVIRQSAKIVFEGVLKMHMASTSLTGEKHENPSESAFISSLLSKLFNVSWTSRGKFGALSSCVLFLGAKCLLTYRDGLPAEVLAQFHDRSLTCYVTELYMNIVASHYQELLNTDKEVEHMDNSEISQSDKERFLETWINPVIKALRSSDSKMKNNIIDYLLPRLLKSDRTFLDYMINRLSVSNKDEADSIHRCGAIIACLRRARVMGFLSATPVQESGEKLWCDILPSDILKTTLCVSDEQIRLDSFAFICESSKTTEAVTSFEFEMLCLFIPNNLNNQSPAFRQNFLSFLKKLFTRLKESLPPLKKLAKHKQFDVTEYIHSYKTFLEWVTSLMLNNLHPGASFARRITSLSSLSLLNSIFNKDIDDFSVASYLNESHIQTLLKCLTDTYEDNKVESIGILTTYIQQKGGIATKDKLLSLFQMSLSLACSTRPQDCETAAYVLLLLLKQPDIFQLMKGHQIELKTNTAKEMLGKINEMFSNSHLCQHRDNKALTQAYASLYLLHTLVIFLHDQNEVAAQSLVTAAANRPMYPTLQCIRYIMQGMDWKSYPKDVIILGRHFIKRLIQVCLDLSKIVSPVVQNSSPEGNVPRDAILGPGLNLADILPKSEMDVTTSSGPLSPGQTEKLSQTAMFSQMLVEAIPEYLVVCCWRSIKEVSLTLGKMCLQIPVNAIIVDEMISENCNAIVSLSDMKTIGAYFTEQLLESVHRGAFELAYAGFQLMCQMLWDHPHSAFHSLPTQWLMQLISEIKSGDPNSKLCVTRRSAGVPFFIQAITSSEPFLTGRQCFHSAMKELIVFALDECETDRTDSGNNKKDAQVHALNILRALYRDTRLGKDVVPYIADGVRAAIRGFKSNVWSVRNSATLLLSVMMTRIFGVKRSKDETAISKKNCQTGRSFFHHFPSLYSFLLSELEEATRSIGPTNVTHLHPSLYPVLLILGRLFPSMLEGSDTSLSLSAFIPYVLKCASSPVFKTRIIAARALQPLARRNQIVDIAKQLFNNIPHSKSNVSLSSSSHIHGSLLQLCELVKLIKDFNASLQEYIVLFLSNEVMLRAWLLSSENECFAIRQSVLELVDSILDIAKMACSLTEVELVEKLKATFISSLSFTTIKDDRWRPLVFEYERIRAMLSLKYLTELKMVNTVTAQGNDLENVSSESDEVRKFQEKIVMNFLQSPFYEVRLQVLCMLATTLSGKSQKVFVTDSDEQENMLPETVEMSGHCCFDNTTQHLFTTMVENLLDHILHMAIELEGHHQCLEKVFVVLAVIPSFDKLIQQKNTSEINKIFTSIMKKIKSERRNEVKAAMLRFTGSFIPALYDSIKSQDTSVQYELFSQWASLIQEISQVEECPELYVSVCHVLLDNASSLLCDADRRLGLLSLHFWNILATLLQEDDLEVQDMAASILSVASGLDKGSFHPSYALEKLPEILLMMHKDRNLCDMTNFLLTWITQDVIVDIKEPNERLFDKSEMNPHKDYIAFTRCVMKGLHRLFNCDKDTISDSSEACDGVRLIKELLDPDLVNFLINTFDKMLHELNLLQEHCQPSDLILNPSRHVSVCHAIFRANRLTAIFKDIYKNENTIQLKISKINAITGQLVKENDVYDILLL